MRKISVILIATSFVASAAPLRAADYYYGDSTAPLYPSDRAIAVQLDTTMGERDAGAFFSAHPCLDERAGRKYIDRGFYRYQLRDGSSYAAAEADLRVDSVVNRVVPVYLTSDSTDEFQVTDLVCIKFAPDLLTESALAILASAGLVLHDSSRFVHNLWQASLENSAKGSPMPTANRVHASAGVAWAAPTFYSTLGRDAEPSDNYYPNQYWLKDTLQGGADVDIDADSAWMIPLLDSTITVAVIDDGLEPHLDLPGSRILPGYSVVGPGVPTNVTPANTDAHGMEVAGILAASHNDTGIVGVMGSCRIFPVRIFYDSVSASNIQTAEAISEAVASGAKVISCSWNWSYKTRDSLIENAIKAGTDTSLSSPLQFTRVFVFSAGNNGRYSPWRHPKWPASMPEVLAVGAIKKTGYLWDYSSYGSALDLMAPSGDVNYLGDMWTTDRMGWLGENPMVTQILGDTWDYDYTKLMGGTSGACPQVSGIAALILARRPDFHSNPAYRPDTTHLIIQQILKRSAVDWYTPGRDDYTGYGLANAYRALLSVIRGDFDNNGHIDTLDVRGMERYCFRLGPPPTLDRRVSDTDGDGDADILDYLRTVAAVAGTPIPPCFRY